MTSSESESSVEWAFPDSKRNAVEDDYEIIEELGDGQYSVVKSAKNRKTGEEVAIKFITRENTRPHEFVNEVQLMRDVSTHPGVVRLRDVYEDALSFYLVLDLVKGGELFDKLENFQFYSEANAADLIRQLVSAVEFLHSKKIVHRDIKPENVLFEDEAGTIIKLCDFGLAERVPDGGLTEIIGTPTYMAPEVEQGVPYDVSSDMYGIGVLMYIMLCGYPPFEPENGIIELEFPADEWKDISPEVKELIANLLDKSPNKRPTATQTLSHSWVAGDKAKKLVLTETIQTMKKYNEWRKSVAFDALQLPELPEKEDDDKKSNTSATATANTGSTNNTTINVNIKNRPKGAPRQGARQPGVAVGRQDGNNATRETNIFGKGFRRFREAAKRSILSKPLPSVPGRISVTQDARAKKQGVPGKPQPEPKPKPKRTPSSGDLSATATLSTSATDTTATTTTTTSTSSTSATATTTITTTSAEDDELRKSRTKSSSGQSSRTIKTGDMFKRATSHMKSPRENALEVEGVTDINELKKIYGKRFKKMESEKDVLQDRVTELENQVMSLSNINVALQSQLMEVNDMMNRLRKERDEARKEREEARKELEGGEKKDGYNSDGTTNTNDKKDKKKDKNKDD